MGEEKKITSREGVVHVDIINKDGSVTRQPSDFFDNCDVISPDDLTPLLKLNLGDMTHATPRFKELLEKAKKQAAERDAKNK